MAGTRQEGGGRHNLRKKRNMRCITSAQRMMRCIS
jgi:hypothetical protein